MSRYTNMKDKGRLIPEDYIVKWYKKGFTITRLALDMYMSRGRVRRLLQTRNVYRFYEKEKRLWDLKEIPKNWVLDVLAAVESGATPRYVGRVYGISRNVIWETARSVIDYTGGTPAYSEETKQKVIQARHAGKKLMDITREFGPCDSTIRKWYLEAYPAVKRKELGK